MVLSFTFTGESEVLNSPKAEEIAPPITTMSIKNNRNVDTMVPSMLANVNFRNCRMKEFYRLQYYAFRRFEFLLFPQMADEWV